MQVRGGNNDKVENVQTPVKGSFYQMATQGKRSETLPTKNMDSLPFVIYFLKAAKGKEIQYQWKSSEPVKEAILACCARKSYWSPIYTTPVITE